MNDVERPLVVDLDGTLIHSDLLVESALLACGQQPSTLFALPGRLGQGKVVLKRRLAERAEIDMASLPWNKPLPQWLREQRAAGRSLVLATAADIRYAEQVMSYLGCFDAVLASENGHNVSAENKRAALVARFGEGGYDYAGNSYDDLAVWRSAHRAIVVNAPAGLQRKINVPIAKVLPPQAGRLRAWANALRLHPVAEEFAAVLTTR
jgi:phosphoserine phosphatase